MVLIFFQSLAEGLKSELRSHLEDVVLGLLMTPPQFDAFILRKATKVSQTSNSNLIDLTVTWMENCVSNLRQWSLEQGLGTDEDVLVEVLTSRTNEEIREMASVFGEGKVTCYVSVLITFYTIYRSYDTLVLV